MKKIKVSIVDKYIIKLEEDSKKGDLIDLRDVMGIDTNPILEKIKNAEDSVYQLMLEKERERLNNIFQIDLQAKVTNYQTDIAKLNEQLKHSEEKAKSEMRLKLSEEINSLKNIIDKLQNEKNLELQLVKAEKDKILNEQILKLTHEFDQKRLIMEKETLEIRNEFTTEKYVLQEEISNLKRERRDLSVKNIGENLEVWADNEYHNQAIYAPNNVSWQKDNEVIAGGKADFIYKVYASEEKLEGELLTSAILEMKSEDPTSDNIQDINRILKKLDKDRNNKGLEYALLVSELKSKADNEVPIKRVFEYDKMYIVRPEYFLTILQIITAFGMKYKELIIAKEEKKIKFKDFKDILTEFETMKNEILDNSIKHINTQLNEIIKQSEIIKGANTKLLDAAELILNRHLKTVENKINDFKITKTLNNIKNLQ